MVNHDNPDSSKSESSENTIGHYLLVFSLSVLYSIVTLFLGFFVLLVNIPGPHSSGTIDYSPANYLRWFSILIAIIFGIRYIMKKNYYQGLAVVLGQIPLLYFNWEYVIR